MKRLSVKQLQYNSVPPHSDDVNAIYHFFIIESGTANPDGDVIEFYDSNCILISSKRFNFDPISRNVV